MATDPKLEAYLTRLDKALGQIPISDRADIVMEIKSHIVTAQEKDPNTNMATLLGALGEPEMVANRYLIERGLKPGRPSRSPIVKWLTIGFLGTLALACVTLVMLVWAFSPLITFNEKESRVQLFGGIIDIDGKNERVKVMADWMKDGIQAEKSGGVQELAKETKEIHIPFSNGKLELKPSLDGKFHWECEVVGAPQKGYATEAAGIFTFNLEKAIGAKCEIHLPNLKSVIRGANGRVEMVKPQSEMDVSMFNGKVEIEQDSQKHYKFDLSVRNGLVEPFTSSNDTTAIPIKVSIANGQISREDSDDYTK